MKTKERKVRRIVAIFIIIAVAAVFALRATAPQTPVTPVKDEKLVDVKADVVYPVQLGDSTVYVMVGNFAAHHNGAIITCDSAVRYSGYQLETFGNVLINKGTVYAYGDRAEYNGKLNEARLYSRLIKVVDGDAVMYTDNFMFNTKTNRGEFSGGGTLQNRDNLLEADRGYYFSNTHEVVGVGGVDAQQGLSTHGRLGGL